MQALNTCDVFISYKFATGSEAAEQLCQAVEEIGLRCWYAGRDAVSNYADEIVQAVASCRFFVVIVDEMAAKSEHVSKELGMVVDQIAAGQHIHMFGLQTQPFEMPQTSFKYCMQNVQRYDAVNQPLENAIDLMISNIQRLLTADAAPDTSSAGPKTVPAPHYRIQSRVSLPRTQVLGREETLEQLHSSFEAGNHMVFVQGIGGIGKSEVTKKYAQEHRSDYDEIVYTVYPGSLKQLFCDPSAIVIDGLSRYQEEKDDAFFQRKVRIFSNLTDERSLLIIDNFDVDMDENLKILEDCGCRVIFTTRNAHPEYATLPIGPIGDWELLKKHFENHFGEKVSPADEPALKELLQEINHHTYTIELLAKQMESSFLSIPEMLELLRQGQFPDSLPETFSSRGTQQTAFKHICTLFSLNQLTSEEKKIMMYLSLMGPQGVPANRFKEWAQLSSFDVVNRLINRSWVSRETGRRLALHPLIAEVVRHTLNPTIDNCREYLDQISDFCYHSWFRNYADNVAVGEQIASVLQYLPQFRGEDYRIFESYCNFLWQIGRFDESIHHCTRLYEACKKDYGAASMEAGYMALRLAGCYYNGYRIEESMPWYCCALRSMQESGADESEELGMAYEKVARCYTWPYDQNLPLAAQLMEKSLHIRERLLKKIQNGQAIPCMERKPCDLMKISMRLAEVYLETGRMYQVMEEYEQGCMYAKKALDLYECTNPDNLSNAAYGYHDIGVCKYHLSLASGAVADVSLLEEAVHALETAVDYTVKRRGELAIDTIEFQTHLGDAYMAQNRRTDALHSYEMALRVAKQLLGEHHADTAALEVKVKAAE